MTESERDRYVADEIKAGRCPFGMLKPEQSMAHCPSGFPGCGCADEYMVNPYLCEPPMGHDLSRFMNQERCFSVCR